MKVYRKSICSICTALFLSVMTIAIPLRAALAAEVFFVQPYHSYHWRAPSGVGEIADALGRVGFGSVESLLSGNPAVVGIGAWTIMAQNADPQDWQGGSNYKSGYRFCRVLKWQHIGARCDSTMNFSLNSNGVGFYYSVPRQGVGGTNCGQEAAFALKLVRNDKHTEMLGNGTCRNPPGVWALCRGHSCSFPNGPAN